MYQPTLFTKESQDSRQKTCNFCGKSLRVYPSRAKKQKAFYCNKTCQHKASVGATNPNWKGGLVSKQCLICSARFQVKQKIVRKGGGNYCSQKCVKVVIARTLRDKCEALRIKKQCQICGTAISVKPSHVNIEGVYCSKKCMSNGYSERLKGNVNPNWRNLPTGHKQQWQRNWRKQNREKVSVWNRETRAKRKQALGTHTYRDITQMYSRQRGLCFGCECQLGDVFHVDHIIPLSKGGSNFVGNLQLLCPQCNMRKQTKYWIQVRDSLRRKSK